MFQEAINDPRTFERFLRERGFSRSRAKAITAKGFKSCFDGSEDIQDIIGELEAKQRAMASLWSSALETKGFEKLDVPAHAGGYKDKWYRFDSFTVDQPSQFKLNYRAHAPRSGPFFLQVKYRSRSGRVVTEERPSHGIRNKPFLIPAGIHQVSVKAKSGAGFAQPLLLTLFW